MAAYVIADVEALDPEAYRDYQRQVPPTLDLYGGRFVVRGGAFEVCEGAWRPARLVVIEFPSLERAHAWYASPEYAALQPIRKRMTRMHGFVIVDGI